MICTFDEKKLEAAAKATVTSLMAEHNPQWRQQIIIAEGIIATMPKPFAINKLIENGCVTGWEFKQRQSGKTDNGET